MHNIIHNSLKIWKRKQIERQHDLYEKLEDPEITKVETDTVNRMIKYVEKLLEKIEREIEREKKKVGKIGERSIDDVLS